MCVLAPNVVNSYFFLIFWFVLVLGLIVNAFGLLFSIIAHSFTLGKLSLIVNIILISVELRVFMIHQNEYSTTSL